MIWHNKPEFVSVAGTQSGAGRYVFALPDLLKGLPK
jgi:hypothetical protein